MPPLVAAMVSLGVLGAIDTYLTATIFPVPVWVTFVAWASFFACGGGRHGLVKSVASNWVGILIASLTLLVIETGPVNSAFAAILVGLGTSVMILVSAERVLDFPPAIVLGFASLVGTGAATGATIAGAAGFSHPTLVAMAAMLAGALFGLVSERGTQMLTTKTPASA
ncbi:hypothetical protein AZC_3799 [Azorhizobium caulinodans ORS 571]|uniref:Transmembrane protein n=1 Tax=Azorhizobium caulinodans (strain ATCC 43989 / DSM 5975 / JCM 20966 / LMG 6465 / NBRC 14845 / NCIMB 13405 / ORS 571) TaxID=438753 RepID=A8INW6_AZOC5|nr:DUF1097 domain-containing protein [Azorhizobium caulinodans]BAF89797.1 hypothetical protein AZC_3799 [Azorhizobium caulinodans ORS 571]